MTVAALGSGAAPLAVAATTAATATTPAAKHVAKPVAKQAAKKQAGKQAAKQVTGHRAGAVKPGPVKPGPAKRASVKPTSVKPTSVKPAGVKRASVKRAAVKPSAKVDAAKPAPTEVSPVQSASVEAISSALADKSRGALRRFYAGREFRPLWAANGALGPAAEKLVSYLATIEFDGLDVDDRTVDRLRARIDAAQSGDPRDVAQAELDLSAAFARYVQAQRRAPVDEMIWADRALRPPRRPAVEAILNDAAVPDSLDDYVARMGWMSRQYVRLRALNAGAREAGVSPEDQARLLRNMDRARLLPGPWTRHILVDASSGRLWYFEGGRQVGTMRVVVGAAKTQTPMMAGMVQWAIVNPYWNVPDYLAQGSIARKVLSGRSLADMHMEALSDWSESPQEIDPETIDWEAVADGREAIRVRQLPGPANSMGAVKFLFPNDEGIYLHDTPERDLLLKTDRHFSNGCIRLERAAELGRWLLQKPLPSVTKEIEQALPLPEAVPVYLTYLTATATSAGLAFRDDVYDRDGTDRDRTESSRADNGRVDNARADRGKGGAIPTIAAGRTRG